MSKPDWPEPRYYHFVRYTDLMPREPNEVGGFGDEVYDTPTFDGLIALIREAKAAGRDWTACLRAELEDDFEVAWFRPDGTLEPTMSDGRPVPAEFAGLRLPEDCLP